MTTSQPLPLAVASLKSAISWTWQLKLDENGLYRWYLDGTTPMQLRGCTRTQAETALRRFVEQSLKGELVITDTCEDLLNEGSATSIVPHE
jgi:hypothetical protein